MFFDILIPAAFENAWQEVSKRKISLRDAAYILLISRIAGAMRARTKAHCAS